MKILFIGDVIGQPGRKAVSGWLHGFRKAQGIDLVIVNAENAAGGKGLTPKTAEELFAAGSDVLTLGNHTWDHKEIEQILNDPRILRPANYPPSVSGHGHGIYNIPNNPGTKVGVLSLMGRYKMTAIDCPFRTALGLLDTDLSGIRTVIVDIHAELTSEKQAIGWFLDGKVSAVLGTHTHVQTADERILPGGTAYLGDVGMTGPRDSIIGMDKDTALKAFTTGIKQHMEVAGGPVIICACLLDVDAANGRVIQIERIQSLI